MSLAPGARLGAYEVTALIGEGGMGKVWQATDTTLERQVAIKVLPDAFAADSDRLARFEREAKTLASLNHPHIAAIYGFEKFAGVHALVMELVEGEDLSQRIARGPLPVDDAISIAKQIAEALEAAHEQGIIHRDLKPANIKLRPDGTVKVLDFGLAKALEPAGVMSSSTTQSPTITSPAMMTGVGVLLGTAAYMSPEQAKGRPADKRSDIWAFGCVLYEMLTGKRAFEGDDVSDVLASVLAREPDWTLLPAALSPVLSTYIRRCLQKDRKQRIGDAQSVRLALEGAFDTEVAVAHTLIQPAWRRALPFGAALVVGGLLIGLTAWRLRPMVEPQAVTRFEHVLPADQDFQAFGRSVIALSRDGRRVVYNTLRGQLYLRSMGSLETRVIPETDASGVNPFFSPDGQSVGYYTPGFLKRISVGGGAPVVICAAVLPFGVSWELDDTILFGQPTGIMRVPASGGGTPKLVIAAKAGEQVDGPHLLPDGDSVLFSSTLVNGGNRRWDQAQIVVQSLSTGVRKVLLSGGSDARYVPTGHLVYAVGNALLAVAFDLARLEVTGGPVSVVEGVSRPGNMTGNTATAHYGISDGGTLVYAQGATGSGPAGVPLSTPVWVNRSGREEPLGAPPRRYVYARLSPDGTRVALDVREEQQDIWVWDLRRRTMPRLTVDPQLDALPVWTPDGSRLVWASQRAGLLNLYWQAADGTGPVERLTESSNQQRPSAFSPDGQQLIVSEGATAGAVPQDLGMLTLNGDGRVTWLVRTSFSEFNGEISPNGRWLAYQSDESGQFEIYVRPFPDVDKGGRLLVSTGGGRQPLWARNGRELFYVASDGALMGVSVDVGPSSTNFVPGTPVKLVDGGGYWTAAGTVNLGRTYDVTADGMRFLRIKMTERDPDSRAVRPRFVIVENWFEELKRLVPTK